MASTGMKVGLGIGAVLVLAVGGEELYLHHRNVEDNKAPVAVDYNSGDPDDLVYVKGEHPLTLKDEKDLKGRTLWISAGGQMDYYPYNGHTVDFDHSQGVLLGTEKIIAKDAVEQKAPLKAAFRIPQGDKQVLLIFTKPGDPKEYAVPVGNVQNGDYTFATDQIVFYDDPHKMYAWKPEIWQAIDEHRPILGMNERQMQMALGQVSEPHGDKIGDRMVKFDDQGKPKMVTFVNGKATKIEEIKQ